MRADRAGGTEKNSVQVSMCAGTCRPQSRLSHASIVDDCRAPKTRGWVPEKILTFRGEKSGYVMVKTTPVNTCKHYHKTAHLKIGVWLPAHTYSNMKYIHINAYTYMIHKYTFECIHIHAFTSMYITVAATRWLPWSHLGKDPLRVYRQAHVRCALQSPHQPSHPKLETYGRHSISFCT